VKPTLVIRATERDMHSVVVYRQYGDTISEAYMMRRDALFQAISHPRIRDQFADIRYDNRL